MRPRIANPFTLACFDCRARDWRYEAEHCTGERYSSLLVWRFALRCQNCGRARHYRVRLRMERIYA